MQPPGLALLIFFGFFLIFGIPEVLSDEELPTSMESAVNVTLEVASAFNTACLQVLQGSNQSIGEQRETFVFVRGLMRGPRFFTATSKSFQLFFNDQKDKKKYKTCYKPLIIFMANPTTRKDFNWLSGRFQTSRSMWLVFLTKGLSEKAFFEDAQLTFDTHLLAVRDKDDRKEISEVYRVNSKSPIKVVNVGTWTPTNGLAVAISSIYHRRPGLEGVVLRTGSIENWPITSFQKDSSGTTFLDGYFARLWRELEVQLNFRSINYRSVDNSTGTPEANGSWNGLVGMLLRREIDVIVSELNINQERTEVMDFSHPLLKTRYQVYFQQPGYNLAWTAVFQPFHLYLWIALLMWIVLGAFALTICYKGSNKFQRPSDLALQPSRTLFFMLQSMCQQGYSQVPESYSCRLVFILAYLLSAIIIPSYSASLISSLTAQTPNRPFDTLQEMLDFKRYKMVIARNSAEYSHFALSNDKLYSRVFNELVVKSNVAHHYDGKSIQVLCNLEVALFGVESTIDLRVEEAQIANPQCKIIKFSQPLSIVYQGLGFRKKDPFTGLIDFHIGRMMAAGIVGRLQRAVWPLASYKRETDFKQVSPSEVFQIFVCLLFGIISALFVLVLEILHASRKKQLEVSKYNARHSWLS